MVSIGVVVADGQRLFAEALGRALDDYDDLDVAPIYPTTGREAVAAVTQFKPSVLLVDYWIPEMNGPSVAQSVRVQSVATTVLFLAGFHVGPCQVREAREAGGAGFLRKGVPLDQVAHEVRVAAQPRTADEREIGDVLSTGPDTITGLCTHLNHRGRDADDHVKRLTILTAREIEILQILRHGLPAKELARRLGITVGTLKNHIHSMVVKAGVSTQMELLEIAEEEGFISATG